MKRQKKSPKTAPTAAPDVSAESEPTVQAAEPDTGETASSESPSVVQAAEAVTEETTSVETQSAVEPVVASDERNESRAPSELQTIVQVKDGTEDAWKEVTNVVTISRNGAGFRLKRPCTVGRLVTLVMPMPVELRAYDHAERLYPVMGLVQYCNEGLEGNEKCYHVGVALIGKRVPESFKDNPLQSYRITGMSKSGLWMISETETQFKTRKHPRFWVALDVAITIVRKERKESSKELAVTQNIGASGASVKCSLDAKIGDKVKFAYKEFNFYTIGLVRDRKESKGETTLHLEFVENQFPMEKLFAALAQPAVLANGSWADEGPHDPPQAMGEPTALEYQRL